MSRLAAVALIVVSTAAASAGEAQKAPERSRRGELWKTPFYLVIGLPRDIIDAPVKAISSVPVANRILIAPLVIVNAVTTVASWSFTDDGMDGGFEAWMACLDLRRDRKTGGRLPESVRDRPWWKNYFPNLRTFSNIIKGEDPKAQ